MTAVGTVSVPRPTRHQPLHVRLRLRLRRVLLSLADLVIETPAHWGHEIVDDAGQPVATVTFTEDRTGYRGLHTEVHREGLLLQAEVSS